jgi:hypothetical protein
LIGAAWSIITYAVTETLALVARPGIAGVIFRDAPNVIGAAAWHEIEMRYGFGQLHALLRTLAAAGRLGGYDPEETLKAGQSAMIALLSGFRSDPPP